MNDSIIITTIICGTLFLSLVLLLVFSLIFNKDNKIRKMENESSYWEGFSAAIRMNEHEDGEDE